MSSKDENENEKENEKKKETENKNKNKNKHENKNENENDKTLMSSNDENEDDETMDQNKKNIIIKGVNDILDKIIDKSKSFEDQIKSIRKVENLGEYYFRNDFGDKELKFKHFKLKLAHLANIIDEKLFEQIFGHKFETLANKLINTTNNEKNLIIVNNINKNKEKLYEEDETSYNNVIQPGKQSVDLLDAINLSLNFNKTI